MIWNYTKEPIWNIMQPIEVLKEKFNALMDDDLKKYLQEVRNKIQTVSSEIIFDEKEHRYFYENKECCPCSYICEMFEEHQDFDKVAQRNASKIGVNWKWLRNTWKVKSEIATTSGTFNHQYAEDFVHFLWGEEDKISSLKDFCYINGYWYPVSPKQVAIYKYFYDMLTEGEIPFAVEIKLIWKEHLITGTFDLLVFSTKYNCIKIRDYKTNAVLTKDYKKPMFSPFEKFNVEPLSHYTIQQNIYSIMLQEIGIENKGKELVWLKDNESYQLISLEDIEELLREAIPNLY